MKKISFLSLIILLSVLIAGYAVQAEGVEIDPKVPDSWMEAPKPASEYEINNFDQAPMLAERVESGDLPRVAERLPEDPPVIEPYDNNIGEYGGTADIWGVRLETYLTTTLNPNAHLGRVTPDGREEVPYLAEDWEYSNEGKTLTLHLREGLKWSDGNDFDADDYMFWWEHVANNEDLSPVPPDKWSPPLMDVTKDDQHTVSFHWDEPNATKHFDYHIWCWWGAIYPEHYMKQFHVDFVDKEKLEEKAEEQGVDYWYQYFENMASEDHPEERGARPTLRPYVAVEKTTNYMILERNPYYPFVDTEGNQLPYIDRVKLNLANNEEMITMKASTGEVTIAADKLKVSDIPLFKRNEEKGDINTVVYTGGIGSPLIVFPNLTHEDSEIREVFQDARFRRAISHAINREEINDKLFFGMAEPGQATVLDSHESFKEEYANSYIEFDLEKANELLDEMGLEDTNGDGYRELPGGESFQPSLITTGPDKIAVLELILPYLQDVGLNAEVKSVSRPLRIERYTGNNVDMAAWHLDRVSQILLPRAPKKLIAPIGPGPTDTAWPEWMNWWNTNGEEGMEPPAEIKEIQELAYTMQTSPDVEEREEATRKLLEAQAENLWYIGTVRNAPQPAVISKDLHNYPKEGYMGGDFSVFDPYYPIQFYLEQD